MNSTETRNPPLYISVFNNLNFLFATVLEDSFKSKLSNYKNCYAPASPVTEFNLLL